MVDYKIQRLALRVLKRLEELGVVHHLIDTPTTLKYISSTMEKNFGEEEALNQEVKKFLVKYQDQFNMGELSYKKMAELTKKKLAKDRNFILGYSEERVSHLAHLMVDGLDKKEIAKIDDSLLALRETKKVIAEFLAADDNLDQTVRTKIHSLKRSIPEGSSDWDVMYQKFFEEESNKRHPQGR